MTAAVIGCGASAKWWWKQVKEDGAGSYGVNDAGKHGMGFHNLIVVNGPHKFGPDRMQYITACQKHQNFFTNLPLAWSKNGIKHPIPIQISQFYGKRLQKDRIVFSKTSPFVAMSMAYNDGFDDIRLFGIDFNDHKTFRAGERYGDHEIEQYAKFAELAAKEGVKIRVTKESALSKFIDTF